MASMPIADPTTTGQFAPMSQTGKVDEIMHASVLQSISTDGYAKPKLNFLLSFTF
jgi:hypothetical protein